MFSAFFIRRPVFACVLSILIVLLGGVAYLRLPVEQFPDVAPPVVQVSATYPGANAQTVADTVAAPLEQEINGVERMIYMSSTSGPGRYELNISFEPGMDVDLAAVLVQNRANIAEPRLPEEVRRLGITTRKQSTAFVGVISIYSPDSRYDDLYLANYMAINMRDEISRLYGVGGVNIIPAKDYGMRIWLDTDKLKARGITVSDVNAAISEQNVQVAAGVIGQQPAPPGQAFELVVTTLGRLADPAEFGDIIVKREPGGRVVRVRDIGRVDLGARDYAQLASYNGNPTAIMPIYQLPGANLVDVAERVAETLERLKQDFPEGLEGELFYDASMFIRASLEEVNKTLFESFVLVVLVVLVFLQSVRMTIIPTLTIPVSLIGTFLVMALLGFSVNMLTMFGLVLAIGIVVDDAIVVVENVERNMSEHGLPPREATLRAMGEIFAPVVSITLVLMAVFVPAASLPGITGSMYRQFALTIAASTAFSALNALTLSPALCAVFLKPHAAGHRPGPIRRVLGVPAAAFNTVFGAATRGYARLSRWTIRAAPVTLVAFAVVLVLTWGAYVRVPTGFVPNEDLGFVVVAAQLPDGASLERSQELITRVAQVARQTDGVANVGALAGFSVIDGTGPSFANAWCVLEPWDLRTKQGRSVEVIMGELWAKVGQFQEAQFLVFSLPAIRGLGNTSGFDLRILDRQSLGREALEQAVGEIVAAANGQSRLRFVSSTFRSGVPQLYLDIDREKAIKMGVPLGNVFQTLETALGSAYVNDFNLYNRTFQVNTQADASFRRQPEDIHRLHTRNLQGDMVPLGALLTVRDSIGAERVTRYNMYPSATINGQAAPGASSGDAMGLMEQIAADKLAPGLGHEWTAMSYQEQRAGGQALFVFGFGLLVVYLILAAQYESWSAPLAVVLSVPLVVVGAMAALFYRGLDNNVFTQIGLVLLIGLGAKNAILIVEFARANRATGKGIAESAVEAARTRFRPILMTSLAFTLGVTPLLVATGAGAAGRRALGTAVFGGMIGATVLGLLFTPLLFVVVQGASERVSRLFSKAGAPPAAHEPR